MSTGRALDVAVVAACPFPEPRGTPVRVLRLSEAVALHGHRVRVFTYHLGTGRVPESLEVRRTPSIATYRKTTPGPSVQKLLVVDPVLARVLRKSLRERPVDVIHAHHYEGLLVALWGAAGLGIPVVYDAHTMLSTELTGYGIPLPGPLLRVIGRQLDRHVPRRADHVIAVSDTIADKLGAFGVGPDDVTVASDGIEDEFLIEPEGSSLPAAPGGAPTLVFAGNLALYQGIDVLLKALARVRARHPDVGLRLLTDSSFRPYEELARRLGVRDAVAIEHVSLADLPLALRRSEVALNPRVDCDGIPLKLLNYMGAARPVVSFEGSAPVVRNGETGLLVENGSVDGFAEAILQLLADPSRAREIGLAAHRYVKEHHRWSSIATRVEAVYADLVGS